MDTQKHDERAYEETTDKDYIDEVFPKGPLGPILGAPKQYEPPWQCRPRARGGDRLNPNGQIFDDDDKTNKGVH
jgi:hypothetical protein